MATGPPNELWRQPGKIQPAARWSSLLFDSLNAHFPQLLEATSPHKACFPVLLAVVGLPGGAGFARDACLLFYTS